MIELLQTKGCGMGVISYYGCNMWVWQVGVASVPDPALKKLEPMGYNYYRVQDSGN